MQYDPYNMALVFVMGRDSSWSVYRSESGMNCTEVVAGLVSEQDARTLAAHLSRVWWKALDRSFRDEIDSALADETWEKPEWRDRHVESLERRRTKLKERTPRKPEDVPVRPES